MPRPYFPPTPAPSTDIVAQEKACLVSPEVHFTLPPPALNTPIHDSRRDEFSTDSKAVSSYHPISPAWTNDNHQSSPSRLKRTSSGSRKGKQDITLPPPPTRPRKIIHMRPKAPFSSQFSSSPPPKTTHAATSPTAKRKQPSSTSVAGRKMARKTAHSLIERRRRSKMNEEFGTLKDMVPACEGQDLHKLAILQAGIDYVRYLESCVDELKAANKELLRSPRTATRRLARTPEHLQSRAPVHTPERQILPSTLSVHSHPSLSSFSPSTQAPATPRARCSTSDHSTETKVVRCTQSSLLASPFPSADTFPLPSPSTADRCNSLTLVGIDDSAHEATAALLMLIKADRRGVTANKKDMGVGVDSGILYPGVSTDRARSTRMKVQDLLRT